MKKIVTLAGTWTLALTMCSAAWAVEDSIKWGMCEKGSRGFVNIFSGWMEVPMQVYKGYNDGVRGINSPAGSRSLGALGGLFRGMSHAVGRTGWGAFEFGGLWARNPTSNEELLLLLDSNYAWEKGSRKAFRCPTATDGMKRVGYRMERGLRGAVLGVAEIPGQMRKADAERRRHIGIPKGVWFAASRIWEGVGDVALLPFAGPETTLNVPYEEIEPWDALHERYYNNVK